MKEVFELYIGGYFGASYSIVKNGDVLEYECSYISEHEKGEIVIIEPTQEQWNKFYSFLKSMNNWKSRYESFATDGTQWSVNIINDQIKIVSAGSNSYPRNFNKFLKEVRTLIGGREFS